MSEPKLHPRDCTCTLCRLILDQQLSQFETEKESIAEAVLEINRRLAMLDENQSWNLSPEQEDTAPATDQMEKDAELENEWVREPAIR